MALTMWMSKEMHCRFHHARFRQKEKATGEHFTYLGCNRFVSFSSRKPSDSTLFLRQNFELIFHIFISINFHLKIALGSLEKFPLQELWQDMFGLSKVGSYKNENENVDEDILLLGKPDSPFAVEVDLMAPLNPEKSPKGAVK